MRSVANLYLRDGRFARDQNQFPSFLEVHRGGPRDEIGTQPRRHFAQRIAAARTDDHAIGDEGTGGQPVSHVAIIVGRNRLGEGGTDKAFRCRFGDLQLIGNQPASVGRQHQVNFNVGGGQAFQQALGIGGATRSRHGHDNALAHLVSPCSKILQSPALSVRRYRRPGGGNTVKLPVPQFRYGRRL
jgi:hypothetical protein